MTRAVSCCAFVVFAGDEAALFEGRGDGGVIERRRDAKAVVLLVVESSEESLALFAGGWAVSSMVLYSPAGSCTSLGEGEVGGTATRLSPVTGGRRKPVTGVHANPELIRLQLIQPMMSSLYFILIYR